jgi:ribonuclease HII
VSQLIEFDLGLKTKHLIGVDEVGRGALAGPVCICATHFEDLSSLTQFDLADKVNDSKKLGSQLRENLKPFIEENSHSVIEYGSVESIDEKGILVETLSAMKLAVEKLIEIAQLNPLHVLVLVDGNVKIHNLKIKQTIIKQGDSKSFHIASASILAKVARDKHMDELALKHPEFNWSKNKGYGTLDHRKAIVVHGPTSHHRKQFIQSTIDPTQQMKLFASV